MLGDEEAEDVMASTFHSGLRADPAAGHRAAGAYTSSFTIYDTDDSRAGDQGRA